MAKERLILSGLAISGLGLAACARTPDAADSLLIQCKAKTQDVVSKQLKLTNGQSFYVGDRKVEVLDSGKIRITTSSVELTDRFVTLDERDLGSSSLFTRRSITLQVMPDQDNTVLTVTMDCVNPQK